ncbi:molybdenum cofactor guanylyltransferase MobA [Pseudoroseomonas globiformis]|uniref:Molybdenum cofactor guanylyltransferase n=1 Tax=Teichococcus globiformis TaxID=2307229 RepID=A0ABV7FYB9_9PROT
MRDRTAGIILAGGTARRMGGGDKPLRLLGGQPLLRHVMARLEPQVDALALNANGDPTRFAAFGLPVVADEPPSRGPLSGILAGLNWAAAHCPGCAWLVTVPGDTPFLPPGLVASLHSEREAAGTTAAMAASKGRRHPPAGLWPVSCRAALADALAGGEERVGRWAESLGCAIADFTADPDPFFNANTPGELAQAEALLARLP